MQFIAKRGKSFDATFFIPAESAVKIDDAFSEIAVELQLLSSEEAKDRLASKFAVLRWLFKPYKTPPLRIPRTISSRLETLRTGSWSLTMWRAQRF
jgi:hypothetical protein